MRNKFQPMSTCGRIAVLAAMAIAVFCPSNLNAQQPANEITLHIGSKAPALDIETWISNRDDAFEQVTEFEDGKIYVIEFWATWCPPCVASMPHLAKLQEKHLDDGVQIISVTDEDMFTVGAFLGRNVRGEEGLTYKQLTSSYCLTSDPDGSTGRDYMDAAGQSGIPTAFLVGKSGLIEWTGHPMEIDNALQEVIADTWDRDAFKLAVQKKIEAEARLLAIEMELQAALDTVDQKRAVGDDEAVLRIMGELVDNDRYGPLKEQLMMIRAELALAMNGPLAVAAFEATAKAFGEAPDALNQLAWSAVETVESGVAVQPELLVAAIEAAQLGLKTKPNDPSLLDTISHLHYLQGDLEKAIEAQQTAIDNAGELAHQLEPFLNQLKAEKAAE